MGQKKRMKKKSMMKMLLGKGKEKERGVPKPPLRSLWIEKERWVRLPLKRQSRDKERWVRLPLRPLRLEKDQKKRMKKKSMMKMLLGKEKEKERGVPKPPLRQALTTN